MAKREGQGIQSALILFATISVILAVTTFVFYRKTEEMRADVIAAEHEKETAEHAKENIRELAELLSFWNQYLMHIVGAETMTEAELNVLLPAIEGDEEMAAIHASYQHDMKIYGEGLPPKKLNYRDLPALSLQKIRRLAVANTDLSKDHARLIEERDEAVARNAIQEAELRRHGLLGPNGDIDDKER